MLEQSCLGDLCFYTVYGFIAASVYSILFATLLVLTPYGAFTLEDKVLFSVTRALFFWDLSIFFEITFMFCVQNQRFIFESNSVHSVKSYFVMLLVCGIITLSLVNSFNDCYWTCKVKQ